MGLVDSYFMNKIILLSVCILSLSGCATMAPVSYDEHCAVQGMKFTGVTQSSGTEFSTATAYNYQTGQTANAYGSSSYSGQSVSCRPPQNEVEKCEVQHAGAAAAPKIDYNDGIGGKRFLTGTGYVLWIIPGLIAKGAFDSQRDGAIKRSQEIANQLPACDRSPASK
jgi:hypothetical protein